MENVIDRTEIFKKYQNQWVAFTDNDELIDSASTLDEVFKKAKSKGYDNPITAKIPDLRLEFILQW